MRYQDILYINSVGNCMFVEGPMTEKRKQEFCEWWAQAYAWWINGRR